LVSKPVGPDDGGRPAAVLALDHRRGDEAVPAEALEHLAPLVRAHVLGEHLVDVGEGEVDVVGLDISADGGAGARQGSWKTSA